MPAQAKSGASSKWVACGAFAVALACCGCVKASSTANPPAKIEPRRGIDLEAARELDKQGVRAFKEGRFEDAVLFFQTARDMGGPPSELWNVARCLERLDRGEQAAAMMEQYLREPAIAADERRVAEKELGALRMRRSVIAIASQPAGAEVKIDGRAAPGATPLSSELEPGAHVIVVSKAGHRAETRSVDVSYGRARVVEIILAPVPAGEGALRSSP